MVGDSVAVEVGQGVVGQPVAVEIQADRVQPAVPVEVEIWPAVPHRRGAVTVAQAVLHTKCDAARPLPVPAGAPPRHQFGRRLLASQRSTV